VNIYHPESEYLKGFVLASIDVPIQPRKDLHAAATDSSAPAAKLRRAIRPAVVLAWSLLAGLLAYLALEEFHPGPFRPFLGIVRLTDRLSVAMASTSPPPPHRGHPRPQRRRDAPEKTG